MPAGSVIRTGLPWRFLATFIEIPFAMLTGLSQSMRLGFGCFLVVLAAATTTSRAATPTEQLQALFEEEWELGLREAPTFATHLGDKRYDDRWPDVSRAAIERRQAHQRTVLERLRAIPTNEFSPQDRLNYRLYERQLVTDLAGVPFRAYLMPLDMRSGIQDEGSLADVIAFDAISDYEAWLTRLRTFPAYMDQTIALMRDGIQARIVQPRIVMQRVPAQIRRQIVDDPTTSLFYKPFKSFPASIPAPEQQRLRTAASEAITQHIVPAYRKFLAFFEGDYLPQCFENVGAWQLPQGESYYAYCAKQFTTTELTPDEIHEIGLQEVARIRAEMERVKRTVGFEGSLLEFFEHLRTSEQFYYRDPQDLLRAYQAFCKQVDPQLPRFFKTLPRIPYGVEPIPDHMAPDTTAGYYRPPAADGSRAGVFFINLYKPEARPKYEMAALSLHEAVPGHHLQLAIATELPEVPMFRRQTMFTAYVEGWALYGESLGDEMRLYADPYSKFGQLTYEIWRAIRLVVDTGIHHKRWTRQQAIDYFKQNAAKTEHDIVNEIDRYIGWPGQALAYKIGELKIKALRKRATEQLGPQFDLREFHDVILGGGALPLDVLEAEVEAWIAKKQSTAAKK